MSDQTIEVLLRKRGELLAQMQGVQSAIFHIDQTLALIGYVDGTKPGGRVRRFQAGELMALIGEAERSGHKTVNAIVQYVMGAKSLDMTDDKLRRKVVFSVKDCRKRLNARGVQQRLAAHRHVVLRGATPPVSSPEDGADSQRGANGKHCS